MNATSETSAQVFAPGAGGYDLLLCPTLGELPPEIGVLAPDKPFEETMQLERDHICFTPLQNMTGDPAISLPMGVSSTGLPIGVQFAAGLGNEATLLSLAYELEAADSFRQL